MRNEMALTADQILAADDLGLKKVTVREWGGDVHIRIMSVGERDAYERMWIGKKDSGVENFRTEYLARVLCDEKGELLFSREQVAGLAKKSGSVMGRLFDEAIKHNNMSEEDVEALGKG
jgi:hypothetical protein